MLSFTIPGEPRGKGRPRATSKGGHARVYTDAATASYENLVKLAARAALDGRPALDEALGVSIFIRTVPPASTSGKRRAAMLAGQVFPTKKPDTDNVVKAVLDGLNKVAFRDDCLVVDEIVSKRYAAEPGVDVLVWTMAERPAQRVAA